MNRTDRLTSLVAEGMRVVPSGMGAVPPRGSDGRPAYINGDPGRIAREQKFVPVPSGKAWGELSPAERQRNRQRFVTWLKTRQPKVWALVKSRIGAPPAAGLGALSADETGATSSESWWQKLTGTVTNLLQTKLAYDTQKDLLQVQLDRAKEGQPPLDTTAYQPTVNVTADPAAIRTAVQYAGSGITSTLQQNLPLIAAAIGAYLLLKRGSRRRR